MRASQYHLTLWIVFTALALATIVTKYKNNLRSTYVRAADFVPTRPLASTSARLRRVTCRSSAEATAAPEGETPTAAQPQPSSVTTPQHTSTSLSKILCCPVSFQPLKKLATGQRLECESTGLAYGSVDDTFFDLTPASGSPVERVSSPSSSPESDGVPKEIYALADVVGQVTQGRIRPAELLKDGFTGDRFGLGVTTFQNPLVSQVYERGWRQSFARAGFPGPEREFKIAQEWLLPVAENGVLVDASCGSGLFTRRFVQSNAYDQVIALDYSESMLRETASLCKQNSVWKGGPSSVDDLDGVGVSPLLVRGDIGRLPFQTSSVDAVHAGAAIHCWPSPALALSEISRVLKPGGRIVLSTFMNPQLPFTNENLRKAVFGQMSSQNSVIRAWEEGELKDLCDRVGLINFECQRNREFIILKAEKPRI